MEAYLSFDKSQSKEPFFCKDFRLISAVACVVESPRTDVLKLFSSLIADVMSVFLVDRCELNAV